LHPRRRFNDWLQRLDDLHGSLTRCAKHGLRQQRLALKNCADRLGRVRPAQLVKQRRELLVAEQDRLREQIRHQLRERRNRYETVQARLRLLGPEQVLARGYSITTDAATGKVLRNAAEAKPGQRIKTRLKTGELLSKVEK
jgi:exodeoxyribonuclease VII large subunit